MNNKQKADEISTKYGVSKLIPTDEEIIAYNAAIEMAEWKDNLIKDNLRLIIDIVESGMLRSDPYEVTINELKELFNIK